MAVSYTHLKDHLLMLIFIYYFKNILSITDIQKLLGPITAKYFKGEPGKDMTYVCLLYTSALFPQARKGPVANGNNLCTHGPE